MLDASTTARKAGLRSSVFGEGLGTVGAGFGPASTGASDDAAATTMTRASTISQIRWPGAITSSRKPAPTLPAMNATETWPGAKAVVVLVKS